MFILLGILRYTTQKQSWSLLQIIISFQRIQRWRKTAVRTIHHKMDLGVHEYGMYGKQHLQAACCLS